jgi:L-lysine 2,3-aminomutase
MASCALDDEPHTVLPRRSDWQSVLSEGICSPDELCRRLGLDPSLAVEAARAAGGFPLLVAGPYLARIRPGDATDPLLLQVIPRAAETAAAVGYRADPLGEADTMCAPGLLRKYRGRILMVAGESCAVHCRYCFRRHFPYGSGSLNGGSPPHCNGGAFGQSRAVLASALRVVGADPSIHEVILSGGDPLTLADAELAEMAEELSQIPHLRRLRIHTRMPVMIPQRVSDELISWIRGCRLATVVVVQVNHAAEIDDEVAVALGRLVDAGIPVLNQSVLLRGINDRADVLVELCERLVDLRVMPYYLHQLDAVAGAAHFEVPIAAGVALMAELRARLPGYAVPRYARELRGGVSKEILA